MVISSEKAELGENDDAALLHQLRTSIRLA
jgi:hypothetical protein